MTFILCLLLEVFWYIFFSNYQTTFIFCSSFPLSWCFCPFSFLLPSLVIWFIWFTSVNFHLCFFFLSILHLTPSPASCGLVLRCGCGFGGCSCHPGSFLHCSWPLPFHVTDALWPLWPYPLYPASPLCGLWPLVTCSCWSGAWVMIPSTTSAHHILSLHTPEPPPC